jgi:hypothetical protein
MVGCLHQKEPGMTIAALGDGSLPSALAAASFATHQSQERHELAWVLEAAQISQFGDEHRGADEADTFEALESFHHRPHEPFSLCLLLNAAIFFAHDEAIFLLFSFDFIVPIGWLCRANSSSTRRTQDDYDFEKRTFGVRCGGNIQARGGNHV